jgi:hypothetical protein
VGPIKDQLAINDLFVRYATALDAGEAETIVGCLPRMDR